MLKDTCLWHILFYLCPNTSVVMCHLRHEFFFILLRVVSKWRGHELAFSTGRRGRLYIHIIYIYMNNNSNK